MRGVPGVPPDEQAQRANLRSAQSKVRKGQRLDEYWRQYTMTFWTVTWSDWAVLRDQWNGTNQQRLLEIQGQRGDLRITMPTLRRNLQHSHAALMQSLSEALLQSMPWLCGIDAVAL